MNGVIVELWDFPAFTSLRMTESSALRPRREGDSDKKVDAVSFSGPESGSSNQRPSRSVVESVSEDETENERVTENEDETENENETECRIRTRDTTNTPQPHRFDWKKPAYWHNNSSRRPITVQTC